MDTAATGAQTLYGWRRESAPGVPGTEPFVFLRSIPPLTAELQRALEASPEINQTGAKQPGIPGAISGPFDIGVALTAAHLLEPYENVLGETAKTTLEAGAVFKYVSTPNRNGANTTFERILSKSPVERSYGRNIKLAAITAAVSAAGIIPVRLAGIVGHGTDLSAPNADVGNTGSYTMGPHVRGPLKGKRDGETLHVSVTRDVAGGGLQVKLERVPNGGAAPTFPGAAQDVAYDSDGNGTWQNAQGTYQLTGTVSVTAGTAAVTGVNTKFTEELEVGQHLTIGAEKIAIQSIASDTALTLASNHTAGAAGARAYLVDYDLGIWTTENRDPLEFIVPGDVTDHGDIDTGDEWTFDADWSDPAATYLDAQRVTGAHFEVFWRKVGLSTWNQIVAPVTASSVISWPVTPDVGRGSRYPFALDRDQILAPTCQLVRKYRDDTFREIGKSHDHVELMVRWLGRQLGSGAYRESIEYEFPYMAIGSRSAPPANAQAIQETINFEADQPPDGSDIVTVTVISDRDWTPVAV